MSLNNTAEKNNSEGGVCKMKKISRLSKQDYNVILSNVINHIEQSKLRAFAEVNKALLHAYWDIGKELSENASYGKSVVEQLSRDLRLKYPGTKGYSVRNLWNMKRFYETYQKLQPVVAELLFSIIWSYYYVLHLMGQRDQKGSESK